MTGHSQVALRVLFATVLLSLPVMVVVREQIGEPYPGLYQPAFDTASMRDDELLRDEAVVVVRDAAGDRHRLEVADLVPAPQVEGGLRVSATRSVLHSRQRMRAPEVVRHVRRRAAELGIDDPVRMDVTWYVTSRTSDTSERPRRVAVRQAYTVRLRP